jgi:hypothetical protein
MLSEIGCDSCDNRVLVEKYSPEHTSVQWISSDSMVCNVFAEHRAVGTSPAGTERTCSALRATINRLADAGKLPISSRSYPTLGRID